MKITTNANSHSYAIKIIISQLILTDFFSEFGANYLKMLRKIIIYYGSPYFNIENKPQVKI